MRSTRAFLLSLVLGVLLACAWNDVTSVARAQDGGEPTVGARVGGPELPGGGTIQCPLPGELHRRNTESKGLGLCVFTSIHHSAIWQNVPQLVEFPRYLIDQGIPGGGYPTKVAELVPRISRSRGMEPPEFLQVENADLAILRAACKSGRMPAITYGISATGRYSGQAIAHMVTLVHADEQWFVVLDNNFPGAGAYEWLSPAEFLRAYCTGPDRRGRPVNSGKGWCVILLAGPPPPPPVPGP